jgi:hypothetical protein
MIGNTTYSPVQYDYDPPLGVPGINNQSMMFVTVDDTCAEYSQALFKLRFNGQWSVPGTSTVNDLPTQITPSYELGCYPPTTDLGTYGTPYL